MTAPRQWCRLPNKINRSCVRRKKTAMKTDSTITPPAEVSPTTIPVNGGLPTQPAGGSPQVLRICKDCRAPAEPERSLCGRCLDKYRARSKKFREGQSARVLRSKEQIRAYNRSPEARRIEVLATKQRYLENPQRLIWKRLRSDVRRAILVGRFGGNFRRARAR